MLHQATTVSPMAKSGTFASLAAREPLAERYPQHEQQLPLSHETDLTQQFSTEIAMEGGPQGVPTSGLPGEAPPFLWVIIIAAAVLWWLWPWLERYLDFHGETAAAVRVQHPQIFMGYKKQQVDLQVPMGSNGSKLCQVGSQS